MKLTVYFDGSLWCGLIEYESDQGHYRVCQYFFGKEPKGAELLYFINRNLLEVIAKHSQLFKNENQLLPEGKSEKKKLNPKRMQRLLSKEKNKPVFSTKAQLAVSEGREQYKAIRKKESKANKLAREKEQFLLKQKKKHQKKRGH